MLSGQACDTPCGRIVNDNSRYFYYLHTSRRDPPDRGRNFAGNSRGTTCIPEVKNYPLPDGSSLAASHEGRGGRLDRSRPPRTESRASPLRRDRDSASWRDDPAKTSFDACGGESASCSKYLCGHGLAHPALDDILHGFAPNGVLGRRGQFSCVTGIHARNLSNVSPNFKCSML